MANMQLDTMDMIKTIDTLQTNRICDAVRTRCRVALTAIVATLIGIASPAYSQQFSATISPPELNGSNGFVLRGGDSHITISDAGDLNGDGVDDIIIGTPDARVNGVFSVGRTYVVFGGEGVGSEGVFDLTALDGSNGFLINGLTRKNRFGTSVSSAGDINGDGLDDVIIGAPSGASIAGQSYVIFGRPGIASSGSLDLLSLDGGNGFVINGVDQGDRSGFWVSRAGDVNGDSIDDVIIGSNVNGPSAVAKAYVVYGDASIGSSGFFDLVILDGANGFLIQSGRRFFSNAGNRVSAVGDVNADGVDDILVFRSTDGAYLIFGGADVGGIVS